MKLASNEEGLPIVPENYKSLGIQSVQYIDPACKTESNPLIVKEWDTIPNESKDFIVPFSCPIYVLFDSQIRINNPFKTSADIIIKNMWRVCKPGGSILFRAQKSHIANIQPYFEHLINELNQTQSTGVKQTYSIQTIIKHSSETPPIMIYKEGDDPTSNFYYVQILKQIQGETNTKKGGNGNKMIHNLPEKKAVPGFSEDGLSILDPTAFVDTVLKNRLQQSAVFRVPNPPTFIPYPTKVPAELISMPNIQKTYSPNFSGMLDEQRSKNQKSYLQIPTFGSFARISASGNNNCCWFDSFLCCMSPAYRLLSLEQRQKIISAFRKWCSKYRTRILAQTPSILAPFYTEAEFINEIQTSTLEISMLAGFLIAWFFGVNIIYIKLEPSGPSIDTTMSIQSPDCKTIFMVHIGGSGAGAHYEPVGILGFTSDQKLEEATSTFLFDWNDPRICQMPNLPTSWTLPNCVRGSANTNNTAVRASVGGKRHRSRRTKKRMGKKRRGTRRH